MHKSLSALTEDGDALEAFLCPPYQLSTEAIRKLLYSCPFFPVGARRDYGTPPPAPGPVHLQRKQGAEWYTPSGRIPEKSQALKLAAQVQPALHFAHTRSCRARQSPSPQGC